MCLHVNQTCNEYLLWVKYHVLILKSRQVRPAVINVQLQVELSCVQLAHGSSQCHVHTYVISISNKLKSNQECSYMRRVTVMDLYALSILSGIGRCLTYLYDFFNAKTACF